MSLWNLIRDFFVQNIFGGYTSTGQVVQGFNLGLFMRENGTTTGSNTYTAFLPISNIKNNYGDTLTHIGFGDWLSSTFTLITLILLVMFLYIFVKWIFKLFSGLLH